MGNRCLILLSFVTLSVLSFGTTTQAADFCIDQGGETWVGKKFKLPRPGQCKAWHGFLLTDFSNVSISTGTGCTSSDGTTFRLYLSSIRENIVFENYIVLPLPSLTNGTNEEFVTGPPAFAGTSHITGLKRIDCTPEHSHVSLRPGRVSLSP